MATRARRRTASAPLVEADWSTGMKRDFARQAMPAGSVWDSTDYLHDKPGMVYKRGGTSYFGPAIGSGTYIAALGYGDYPSGGKLAAIGSDNHLWHVTASAATDIGSVDAKFALTRAKPTFFIAGAPLIAGVSAGALIFTSGVSSSVAEVPIAVMWDGTTMTKASLDPSAPGALYSANYKSRLVLDGGPVAPSTLVWAPAGFAATNWIGAFDPNATIDFDYPMTGLAALQNALLVFSLGHTERLTGSDPPPDSDMERGVIGDIGCIDGRSICVYGDSAIFANSSGVYVTNGAAFDSLTDLGGIGSYWQSLFAGYTTSWRVAAGLYRRRFYVVTIIDEANDPVAGLICDVPRRVWSPITNVDATMFASSNGVAEDLYYASGGVNRLVIAGGIWHPFSFNKADADGTPVEPVLETRAVPPGPTLKHFGYGHLTYDLDGSGDDPELTVSVAEGVEATTFSAVSESPLPETTGAERKRFGVRRYAQAVTVRIEQTNPSARTEIYGLEIEAPGLPVEQGGV